MCVSVIIPAYNSEKYIRDSIESVINQTYKDWELVIVDDGSSDQTLAISKQFAKSDCRIKVFSQKNQGVSAARNVGIDNAIGTYLAFLDSDDVYKETFLEKMTDRIMTGDCEGVYCGFLHEKDGVEKGAPYAEGNILECYALEKQRICIITFMIKRAFVIRNNIKFTIGTIVGEDQEFIFRCGISCTVKSVPEYLVIYKNNVDSVTNTFSMKKITQDIETRARILSLIESNFKSIHKEKVLQRLLEIQNDTYRLLNRKLWGELKKKNFNFVHQELSEFGNTISHKTKKNLIWTLRIAILNSKSKKLWKFFAIFPTNRKKFESTKNLV